MPCPALAEQVGRKADPIIISTLPGSPVLCLPAPPAVGTGVGRQGRRASLFSPEPGDPGVPINEF